MQSMQNSNFLNQSVAIESNLTRPELSEVSDDRATLSEVTMPVEGLIIILLGFGLLAFTLIYLRTLPFWKAVYGGIITIKPSNQIPCFNCRFFHHSQYLHCAVHPSKVLKTEAIHCPDYYI